VRRKGEAPRRSLKSPSSSFLDSLRGKTQQPRRIQIRKLPHGPRLETLDGAWCATNFASPLYFQTPAAISIPAVPTGLSPGTSGSPGPTTGSATVTLGWNASSGATSYEVAVKDVASGVFVEDSTIGATSFTTSHLSAGKQYVWNVDACNSAGPQASPSAPCRSLPGF